MSKVSIEERLDRLESLDAIRQLPARYALCLDMRDMNAMVSLFTPDVRVGREQSGRQALRAYMDGTLRSPFTGTSHHIGGHIIEFDDADHAHGIVYSKNEHETPVGNGSDDVCRRLCSPGRPLVFCPPSSALLVRHRPQQAAGRGKQDALAGHRMDRRQFPQAVPFLR